MQAAGCGRHRVVPVCVCVCVCVCVRVYVCVYVLACRQESLRNDSGSEREAVGCVFGRTTENSEIIVHYGIFSIIDRTSYRGQNYRINTIIIVHLATLVRLICRLSRETKQYPIRKQADRSITNRNKHSHAAAQKDLDTIIAISSCH